MALLSPSSLLVVHVIKLVILVQVFLEPAALAQCTAPMDPCPTTLDCGECDETNGGNIPDPDDCHRYYICTDDTNPPMALPIDCPDGQVFDQTTLLCSDTADCTICSETQVCVFDCSTSPSFASSRYDCNEYYECAGTTAIGPLYCDAENPFFDGGVCQADETLCCRCQPFCDTGANNYVIDPVNCRKYWACIGGVLQGSSECDDGVFDTTQQLCSTTSRCVTECPNVVNTDGCIDLFTCLEAGLFPKCPKLCVDEYYECEDLSDKYQVPETCPTNTVFHPDDHICVNKEDCPYPRP